MTAEMLLPTPTLQLVPLVSELQPLFNLDKKVPIIEALKRLPFVAAAKLERDHSQHRLSLGIQHVPLERVVCSPRDMKSWAGEGSVKRLPDGSEEPTISRASSMARAKSYAPGPKPLQIGLFRDQAGEVWGRAIDGSHRVIAAKMNGESTIDAEVQTTMDPAAMDYYPGDVILEASAKAQ